MKLCLSGAYVEGVHGLLEVSLCFFPSSYTIIFAVLGNYFKNAHHHVHIFNLKMKNNNLQMFTQLKDYHAEHRETAVYILLDLF